MNSTGDRSGRHALPPRCSLNHIDMHLRCLTTLNESTWVQEPMDLACRNFT
jgi:hypothetical protein